MSVITEHILESWEEFDNIVDIRAHRAWVYRGHSVASWKLESSLYRAFSEVEAITPIRKHARKIDKKGHEKIALDKFSANAHLYLTHVPKDNDALSWLAIMQHHGAPTRMLDFTFSPYVAAYFALEAGTEDAAIYSLKHSVLKEIDANYYKDKNLDQMYKNLLSTENEEFLYVFEPHFTNQRLMAQQGVFIIPSKNDVPLESIIALYKLEDREMVKYIIPKNLRREGLKKLQKMNITAHMLFPGLDGFCRSFKFLSLFPLDKQKRIGEL